MFFDRYMAGKILAKKLTQFKHQDSIIYALPKGGVPVGYEIAKELKLPLDFITVQKIGHPINREYGICSVSESGTVLCDETGTCGIDRDWLLNEALLKDKEAIRRRNLYKHGEPALSAENKIAIIVDDGIATGLTMRGAIQTIQDQWPEKIIVATPVMPHEILKDLQGIADKVITVVDDRNYRGLVSDYYTDFLAVSDFEVINLLAKANQELSSQDAKTTQAQTYSRSNYAQ